MCIHKYRTLARFGLMHMVATNICTWLRVVIQETVHDIERTSDMHWGHHNYHAGKSFNVTREFIPQKNLIFNLFSFIIRW
jgi:hypothetical protein